MSLIDSRTLMYTPELTITARRLNLEVGLHVHSLSSDIERAPRPGYDPEFDDETACRTELVIIDQADRPRKTRLEQLRDFFDRSDLGLILIGMPGFDRQLARYPQLYSRIGFAHQYQPLDPDDIPTVLAQYWDQLNFRVSADELGMQRNFFRPDWANQMSAGPSPKATEAASAGVETVKHSSHRLMMCASVRRRPKEPDAAGTAETTRTAVERADK